MKISINSIEKAKEFVSICSKYHDGDILVKQNKYQDSDIDVKQGRQIINGKSILGIFSLNLVEPVKVIMDSENDNSKIGFYNNIQKWKTGNND